MVSILYVVVSLAAGAGGATPGMASTAGAPPAARPAAVSGVAHDSAARWSALKVLQPAALPPMVVDSPPPQPSLPPPPPPLVHYSDWYNRRLTIHKIAAFAILPLFAVQYVAGRDIFNKGQAAPQWAKSAHNPLAVAVSGLFVVNTVTGLWNLWDSRKDPSGRTRRTIHSVLMLLADAGFVATGITGWNARRQSKVVYTPGGPTFNASRALNTRRLHKYLAYSSMGLTLISFGIMLPPLLGGQ